VLAGGNWEGLACQRGGRRAFPRTADRSGQMASAVRRRVVLARKGH